jgi:autotransporter-associated beta strand protein
LGTPVFGSNAAGYTLSTAPDGADTLVILKLMGVTPETWNTSAGGSWAAAGSWFPSGAPNSVGATAEFLPNVGNTATIANGGVVTLDGNETVGTLIFQNSNSFTISAGTSVPSSVLHIQAVGTGSGTITDSVGSHTITAPVSLDSAVTNVTVSTAGTSLTFGGAVEGIGALSINPTGAGTVILSANNTYGGATTIGGGTLQVGTGTTGSLGTSVTPVVNKGALIMDVNTNQTISVGSTPANGTGSITQNGTGVLALSGVNNAGAIAINHSEIQLATSASLTATGDLTMAASTLLDLNGNSATVGGLSGAGTIDNVGVAAATPTLSFGGDGNSNTFSGIIQNSMGTVSVAKAGNGTETLSAINTYTGGTTISGGAILVTSSSGVNSGVGSGTITVGATNGLQLGNGVTLSNPISITVASSEFEDVPSGSATLSGPITASGSNQYRVGTISATSTLNLTGASTGGTNSIFIITRGNVVVDGSGASITSSHTTSAMLIGRQSATSTLNLTIENGGQLNSADGIDFGSNNAADDEGITLTVQSASSVTAGGPFNLNDDQTVSTPIALNITGGSSLTAAAFQNTSLAGGSSSTVLINGGSSIIASANDTVAGTGASETGALFLPEFTNGDLGTDAVSFNVGTGGAIINNGGFNVTIGQPLGDGGGGTADTVTYTGTGTTVIANSNSYGGNTTISAGTVVIANNSGSATSTGTVTVTGGTLASASPSRITLLQGGSVTPITGSGATAAGGVGVGANLDNAGAGVITGPVIVGAAGTIAPGEVGSIGTMAFAGLTTVSGSTINFDLGTGSSTAPTSATGDLLLLNGTFSIGSGTALTFGGTPTVGDYYRLIGGSSITSPTIAAAIASEFILPAGFSLNTSIDPDFIDLFVSSIGPATLTWNDSGGNTPADGRTWDINTNKNWNSGGAGNVVYTEPGGANNPNVIFNDRNNSASNTNAYNVTLSTLVKPSSVTVNNTTGNYTISGTGTIGGTGSLTKSGTGTLTLSTPNTYSGGTIVTAGRLLIGQAGTNAVFSGPTLTTANTLTALPTGALSVSGNGIVQLADGVTNQTFVTPGAHSTVVTSNINLTSLSLTGDGTLDIGNNRIIIDYTTGNDPIASIKQWIANGFADGDAVGALPAIISSDVGPNDLASGFSYGIGYADGADGAIAGLPSGEIEIMYTLLGDANLDGTVNSEDFTPFSNNLNESGRSWDQGDFNYDGTVNSEDFTPFSHDLNESASLAASESGTLLSPLIGAGGISLTNVPEPASTGLLTIGALSVLARRRRKAKA